jgi:hypothetical protein
MIPNITGRPIARVVNPARNAKIVTDSRIEVSFLRVEIETAASANAMMEFASPMKRSAIWVVSSRGQGATAAWNHLERENGTKPSRFGIPHLWQWLRAHNVAVADDAVELQDIGGDRVELVIGQRYFEGCP